MDLYNQQKELDKAKWEKSVNLGIDACGTFHYCGCCEKHLDNPCARALFKMTGVEVEEKREIVERVEQMPVEVEEKPVVVVEEKPLVEVKPVAKKTTVKTATKKTATKSTAKKTTAKKSTTKTATKKTTAKKSTASKTTTKKTK